MNLLGYLFTQRFLSDNDSLPSSLRLICPGQGYRLLGQFLFSLLAQINLGGQVGDAQVKLGVHRQKLARCLEMVRHADHTEIITPFTTIAIRLAIQS